MHKNQVSIIGGGVAGLALAIILACRGIAVNVIERHQWTDPSQIKPTARTTALMQGSITILRRAGKVWNGDLQAHSAPLYGLSMWDDSLFPCGGDSIVKQDFKPYEIGEEIFGYNIPLGLMIAHLAQEARKYQNIVLMPEMTVQDIIFNDSRAEIILEGGQIIATDLVIGADGRQSLVRDKAGIGTQVTSYGQKAITCLIDHSQPHHGISVEFHRAGGPFTLVPLPGNRSAIVWVEKDRDADAFMALSRQDFVEAIQQRSRDILGKIELVQGSKPESWPLVSLKADKLYGKRAVVIAEAAHVISPIGAQGLNLSLRDVDVLADTIIGAMQIGQDIGGETVLASYAHKRQRDIGLRMFGVDALNRSVANDNPLIRKIRRLGLRSLSHIGPLRSLMMQEGLVPLKS